MKRLKTVPVLIAAALMAMLLMSLPGLAQEGDQAAIVLRINGTLELRHSIEDDWTEARPQTPLYNGSQVRTGTGDKAIIMYPSSGTRVLINENTTIEIQADIESAGARPTTERTRLIFGEIFNQARGNYEVETPSAVASVRGTDFNARTEGGTDTFIGIEGLIEIMNQFGSVLLGQFQRVTADEDSAPTEPEDLTENEARRLVQWTDGVEPTWRLNLVPENGTGQDIGDGFLMSVLAYREGRIDPDATFALTEFSSSSRALEFSADDGGTWSTQAPTLTLVNGQASVLCRITEEGQVDLVAAAEDAETAYLTVTASEPKDTRTIELRFTRPDGTGEKTLIWNLEEK